MPPPLHVFRTDIIKLEGGVGASTVLKTSKMKRVLHQQSLRVTRSVRQGETEAHRWWWWWGGIERDRGGGGTCDVVMV